MRWTAAGMMEATKGFRRLKAHKQLPILRLHWLLIRATHTKQKLEENLQTA
jgi:putative transposase